VEEAGFEPLVSPEIDDAFEIAFSPLRHFPLRRGGGQLSGERKRAVDLENRRQNRQAVSPFTPIERWRNDAYPVQ